MNRWLVARSKAYEIRKHTETQMGSELYGGELIDAIIAHEKHLTCLECPGNDPLLGNDDNGFDQARYYASTGLIVVSRDLVDEEERTFYKAHELGHYYVHTRKATCQTKDVDPTQLVLTLPYAEGRIAAYHPRQAQENEASVFAIELLVPSSRLEEWFDHGLNASELAMKFQVPRYTVLSQMTTVLLAPSLDFEEILAKTRVSPFHWNQLDKIQTEACCTPEGPVLVQAGPGTGKTRTLTSRIEWLITNQGVAPERILALTFSNKATEELRFRLRQTVPNVAHQVTVSTFHGFGLELLHRYSDFAGLSSRLTVIDPIMAEILLEENLIDLNLLYFSDPANPGRYLSDILSEIARAKEELINPDKYMDLALDMEKNAQSSEELKIAKQCQEVGHVYYEYDRLLRENGFLDYGDLVIKPVHFLRNSPDDLAQLQSQYEHVLVDEYQDINRANGELVRLLAGKKGVGLWAVGDLRQSIYRFRGASPAYIRRFNTQYPDAKILDLQTNYRASEQLVNFTSGVATQMGIDLPKPKWLSHKGPSLKSSIQIALADDKQSEWMGLGDTIHQLIEEEFQYQDIAILCRTNSHAEEIAQILDQIGIPTLHLGKFFFRKEVKDLLALLCLATDGHGVTWLRIASLIREPLLPQNSISFWEYARGNEKTFPAALKADINANLKLTQPQHEDIAQLSVLLNKYAIAENPKPWSILTDFLFEFGHYLRSLRFGESAKDTQALLAIAQLINLARAFGEHSPANSESTSTKEFINHVRRLINNNDSDIDLPVTDVDIDAVRILTIHKSKGLEFQVVFVPNLAKGRFPSRGRRSSVPRVDGLVQDRELGGEDLEEESCLLVAITRAKSQLILSRAQSYYQRLGRPISSKKSKLWTLLDTPLEIMGVNIPTISWRGSLDLKKHSEFRWPKEVGEFLAREGNGLEVSAVKVFQRCPLQFFYRYVLGLAIPSDRDIYLQFHKTIYSVADQLQSLLSRGQIPSQVEISSMLDEEFAKHISPSHAYATWYRKEAEARMRVLLDRFQEKIMKVGVVRFRVPATVTIQGMDLNFHLDDVVDQKDKRIVSRYKTGRVFKSHLEDPYLALYRKAAAEGSETPVEVRLSYLATRERVDVIGDKDEKILAKLSKDIINLRDGHFPPEPSDNRFWQICSGCSFLFICPKGENP